VQRGGEVRAAVMDAVTAEGVKAHLDRWADRDAALMTDELNVCGGPKRFWRWHFTVAHGEGEFHRAEDAAHVDTAESFDATLERAHVGVYHSMSPKHLLRYASECVSRWNGRKRTTLGRLAMALRNGAARPLPYRALVA